MPRLAVGDRAHAVPLDLEGPLGVVGRQLGQGRLHRLDRSRQRLAPGLGRVHAVDHPVLAAGLKQRVAAAHPLAVEAWRRSSSPPTSRPRRCRCPRSSSDRRRTRPSGSRRGSRGTRAGGPRCGRRAGCRLGSSGHAARQRPGDEHAVVLEPQVPVQPGRVVLLDHEPALRSPAARRALAGGLGRRLERALRAVGSRSLSAFAAIATFYRPRSVMLRDSELEDDGRAGVRRDRDRRRARRARSAPGGWPTAVSRWRWSSRS